MVVVAQRGLVLAAACLVTLTAPAGAQESCQEFCAPPPCYRDPLVIDCNPECHCLSPDYPECDPQCKAGEICDPSCDNHCWDQEFGDTCTDAPPPCQPGDSERLFEFIDDQDDDPDDGQIFVRSDREPFVSCGTLRVEQTGYYAIFDSELSESCSDQLDETGYLTITNSCNGQGWATERNARERFVVPDSDNSEPCDSDDECGSGKVCREGNSHGRCCVPAEPVFMGTFLLVAGEDNRICINHWCPDWRVENSTEDFGFVVDGCEGSPNSIHFQVAASALACLDDTTLQDCSWGCAGGECLPDPCDSVSCDRYCKDGECLDHNPCDDVNCLHGCVRGRCLQAPNARGADADGDGFSNLADCNDGDAQIHPNHPEECGNGVDDDCDGTAEEACGAMGALAPQGGAAGSGAGADGPAAGGDDGCGCQVPGSSRSSWPAWPLALCTLGLLVARRRGRR
jgi:MYXO-CTERM domain-containing protein